jgi:hypothetical protein
MPGPFTATADQLDAISMFLNRLTEASDQRGVRLIGSFTVQLPEDGDTIDARWDEDRCQYVLSDQVGR